MFAFPSSLSKKRHPASSSSLFILILAFASFDIYIKIIISFLVGKDTFFEPFVLYNAVQNVNCPLVGWWVGFGFSWAKSNVLQKRWLVCRLAALLILRSVSILSFFLSVYVSTFGRTTLAPNSLIDESFVVLFVLFCEIF
jgi:hypothetical protein